MQPDDEVLRLCGQGMQAEADGRDADASLLFRQAWDAATDDYQACVAAHYLARHQATPEATLDWNRRCLDLADRVGDDRVRGFYPSLHLAMARAHQALGGPREAHSQFQRAAERIDDAAAGPYRDGIRFTVAAGLRGTAAAEGADHDVLAEIAAGMCARADLQALGILLPAYLGDLGTAADRIRLLTALQMLASSRSLPEPEQALLHQAISRLTADSMSA